MAKLNVGCLFPGSGKIREEGHKLLTEKIAYLEETAGRILALHEKGWDYTGIRRKIFGKEMLIAYFTLGHFSGRNLVRSFIEDCPEPRCSN